MAGVVYPSVLLVAQWEKQKGVLDKPTGIGDALKAMKKAFDGFDADLLDVAKLSAVDELEARAEALKGSGRKSVKAVADQAATLGTLARKWEGEFKKLPAVAKTAAPAAAAVGKAAAELAADLTKAVDAALADVEARRGKAASSAAKAGAKSAEAPAEQKLVRAKVLEALRMVRANAPGAPPVQFMICTAQKGCAVYMSKAVSASHKTLLQALLPGDTGFKFYTGTCIWEAKTHTFVGDNVPSGLGKRLQVALLDLTGARIKVRVRRSDGEVEEVGGDANLDELESEAGESEESTGETAADPMKALQARAAQVAAALAKAAEAGQPLAAPLKQKLAQALASAKGADGVAAAAKAVETIAKALATLPPVKPATSASAEQAWAKARDAWRNSIEAVDGQIASVREKMLASGNADLKRIADRGLPALTDNHKTPVMRALFEIDGSSGDAKRAAVERALASVAAFRRHVQSDPMIQVLDANSKAAFGVELTIRSLIGSGLGTLDGALQQLAAA